MATPAFIYIYSIVSFKSKFQVFTSHSCILFSTLLSIVHIPTVLPANWVRADDESIDVLESRGVKGLNSRASWIFPKVLLPRVRCYRRARGEWKIFIAKPTVAIQSEILAKPIAHCYELLPLALGLRRQVELIRVIQK